MTRERKFLIITFLLMLLLPIIFALPGEFEHFKTLLAVIALLLLVSFLASVARWRQLMIQEKKDFLESRD